MATTLRPRALFIGTTYAGWRTRQLNLEAHVDADGRVAARYQRITGWQRDGLFERIPGLPGAAAGRLRAAWEARHFAAMPRPDVIWTSCLELAAPYLWAQYGRLARPLVYETDWTFDQQERFAEAYFGRGPRTGVRRALGRWQERVLFDRVTLFTPISNWAADGLRALGIDESRIHVLHPGVDLERWRMPARTVANDRLLRLLFVGGDFERKGGAELLEVVTTRFSGEVELDIVTRTSIAPRPGVRVHRAEPNSPELLALFAAADLFVLPTRAECFGHVSVEAAASSLPAIVGDVGGARDIISDGATGWLMQPGAHNLADALARALEHRDQLPAMGARARRLAEERFDGRRNDSILVDLLLEQAGRSPAALPARQEAA